MTTVENMLPAVSPFTNGVGSMTSARYTTLAALAELIFPISPAKNLTGELGVMAKALIIAHLHVSTDGDLDKSSVSVLGSSYSRNSGIPVEKTSYWLTMESVANMQTKSNRVGAVLVERADADENTMMRLDNGGIPSFKPADSLDVYDEEEEP